MPTSSATAVNYSDEAMSATLAPPPPNSKFLMIIYLEKYTQKALTDNPMN